MVPVRIEYGERKIMAYYKTFSKTNHNRENNKWRKIGKQKIIMYFVKSSNYILWTMPSTSCLTSMKDGHTDKHKWIRQGADLNKWKWSKTRWKFFLEKSVGVESSQTSFKSRWTFRGFWFKSDSNFPAHSSTDWSRSTYSDQYLK